MWRSPLGYYAAQFIPGYPHSNSAGIGLLLGVILHVPDGRPSASNEECSSQAFLTKDEREARSNQNGFHGNHLSLSPMKGRYPISRHVPSPSMVGPLANVGKSCPVPIQGRLLRQRGADRLKPGLDSNIGTSNAT